VTLNRPQRLNAINTSLLSDLHSALVDAQADPAIRVVILTGAGRAFCAGDDLREFDEQRMNPEAHVAAIQQITRDLVFGDALVLGAVHGYAVGGGFEWLLNCDLVVAADNLTAFFPEMRLGQFVTGAVTHILPAAVGHQRAVELLILGERQSAQRLEALGLVNWVVAPDQVLPRANAIADALTTTNAWSVTHLKRLLSRGRHDRVEHALRLEEVYTTEAFRRPEAAESARQFRAR
jgi:enoyl-CoA hydratase/carnithine racemase